MRSSSTADKPGRSWSGPKTYNQQSGSVHLVGFSQANTFRAAEAPHGAELPECKGRAEMSGPFCVSGIVCKIVVMSIRHVAQETNKLSADFTVGHHIAIVDNTASLAKLENIAGLMQQSIASIQRSAEARDRATEAQNKRTETLEAIVAVNTELLTSIVKRDEKIAKVAAMVEKIAFYVGCFLAGIWGIVVKIIIPLVAFWWPTHKIKTP